MQTRFRSSVVALALLTSSALLAGCSEDDKGPDIGSSSAPTTAATTTEPSLPVPEGVELTTEGSQLAVGATATVAYQVRQDVVGVLEITVSRLEETTFKKSFVGWDLDAEQKKANPYFVRATITNVGETDLGDRRPPLYIVDGANTLVESTTFASAFTSCEPGSFPKRFPTGKSVDVCMVFLSPAKGALTAVSFRPTQDFDPITWTGDLEKAKRPKPDKPAKSGKPGQGDEQGDQQPGDSPS